MPKYLYKPLLPVSIAAMLLTGIAIAPSTASPEPSQGTFAVVAPATHSAATQSPTATPKPEAIPASTEDQAAAQQKEQETEAARNFEAIQRAEDAPFTRLHSRTEAVREPITITVNLKGEPEVDECAGPVIIDKVKKTQLIAEHDVCPRSAYGIGGWDRYGWLQEGQQVSITGGAPTLKVGNYRATQFVEFTRKYEGNIFAGFDHKPAVILQVCIPWGTYPDMPERTLLIGLDPV